MFDDLKIGVHKCLTKVHVNVVRSPLKSKASWLTIAVADGKPFGDNGQQYETIPLGGIREVYERVIKDRM